MYRAPHPLWQLPRGRAVALFGAVLVAAVLACPLAGVYLGSSGSPFGGVLGRLAPGGVAGGGGSSGARTAAATPALTITPAIAPVGSNVTFNASGFAHGVTFTIVGSYVGVGAVTLCSGKTTGKGLFGCVYTVPQTIGGPVPVNATDAKGTKVSKTFTVASSVTATPSTGVVGTTVAFHAYGFGGKDLKAKKKTVGYPVEIAYLGPAGTQVEACLGNTSLSLNGSFYCSYVLPTLSAGPHTIDAFATNESYNATTTFTVLPSLAAGPTYGPIGTSVTFAGSGFTSLSSVNVTWSYGPACSATSLSSGSFTCSFVIPSGTPGQPYTFTATDAADRSASTQFVLTYLDPQVVSGPVGTQVNFTGGGFAPDRGISLTWAGGSVCPGGQSTSGGLYTCDLVIPATPGGAYVFTADDGVGDSTTALFTVEPFLHLSATYGEPLTELNISGTGFGPSVAVNVTWASSGTPTVACSLVTEADGSFYCPFQIPADTPGAVYTFTARDALGETGRATFVVTYLTATPSSGARSTTVTLNGGGFTPGQSFSITWAGRTLPSNACTATTVSATGTFHCSYATGAYLPAGTYPFAAVDAKGLNATAAFRVTPHLTLTPSGGSPNASVTFGVTGFGATTLVSVRWPGGTTACSAMTSGGGAMNCTITMPPTPAGSYVFNASDSLGHTALGVFLLVPSVSVHPTSGVGNTPVRFLGRGFAANSKVTVSSSLGLACGAPTATLANGTFTCSYTVPQAQAGSYTFTATDNQSNSAQTNPAFALRAALELSSSTGPVGTLLMFTGAGFNPSHVVNVTWTKGLACTGTALPSGAFSCSFTIPSSPSGSYTFTARDYTYPLYPKEKVGDSASATFKVAPSVGASPSSGGVGSSVTFSGFGFLASATVAVSWVDGTACSGLADTNGAFSCSFTLPAAGAGSYTFTAEASPSVEANTTFTVVPSLSLLPSAGPVGTTVDLSASGIAASSPLNIVWSGGTACTGTSSSLGVFDCSFAVPATPAGSYTFSVVVDAVTVASAPFTLTPSLGASPTNGPVGTLVAFRAYGFGASIAVNVTSSLGTACVGTTASNGSYACDYTVPSAPSGAYAFTARDALGNHATVSFGVGAVLAVAPSSGPVGSPIEFRATGFAASTPMTIGWSGGTVCSGMTGPAGRFACNTTMPAASLGGHAFTATAGPSTSATFSVVPSLVASPTSGGAGTSVTFFGFGFPASTSVTVRWTGPTTCSATTATNGSFSCAVAIPAGTAGALYLFTAKDGAGDQAGAGFTVVTGLTASPSHGPDLTATSFVGSNFPASTPVSLSWIGGSVCSTMTNASGGFACPFTVPSGTAGGAYNFTATAGSVNASALFTVSYLSATPTGLEDGVSVALSGGGFEPLAGFTIAAPWGTACTGTASSAGTIACSTTVPDDEAAGVYSFDANDSHGDLAQAGFAVFTLGAPMASPGSVDVGYPVTFSVSASDGGGALTYTWEELPSGCAGTTDSIACSPSAPVSDASITVTVNDSAGYAVTSSALLFSVYADPSQAPPSPSASSVDIGTPVTFTAEVTGGAGGGSYVWSASAGLGCSPSTGPSLDCVPSASGSYHVAYNWTDANGVLASGSTALAYAVGGLPTQSPALPSQPAADENQPITFTAQVSGGSPGGSYAWSASADLNCAATSGPVLSCRPSAAGTFSVSYAWTDGSGVAATGSTALSYVVSTDPVVGAPAASPTSVDVGQTAHFSVSASGEAGGLTYLWNNLPSNCSSTASSFSCVPSAAVTAASITVKVTDANGYAVTSSVLTFTVFGDPTIGAPTATIGSVDVGQPVGFSVTAFGGSGGLTYSWHNLPGCTGTGASFTCTPSSAGTNLSITVTVTDSNGFSVTSAALLYTVYADPTQGPANPSRAGADLGQPVSFTASTHGGAGGGSFVWTASGGLNCTASTGRVLSCLPNAAGTFSVSYVWTDANGAVASGSTVLSFTVATDPSVSAPTPNPPSVDLGQSVTFSATGSGGADVYAFAWTTSTVGLNCSASTSDALSCFPTIAGTYTVSVSVVDANGFPSPTTTSALFTVYSAPSISSVGPSRTSVDIGETLTFLASTTGGSGSPSFTWTYSSELGCTPTTAAMLVCDPKDVGTFTVSATVTDSNRFVSPSVSSPTVTVSSSPSTTVPSTGHASTDVGRTVTFTTTASGGSGSYHYAWTVPTGLNCTVADAPSLVCVPTTAGSYTVTVEVTDTDGASATPETSATFTVFPPPSTTMPTPKNPNSDVGQSVVFNVTATGGSGVYTYTWHAPALLGCILRTTASIPCVPTLPGTYRVNVTVTDTDGGSSPLTFSAPYSVYQKPVVVLIVVPAKVLKGHSVTFTAVVTGGSGGLTYTWKNIPNGCPATPTTLVFTCTPTQTGNTTVALTVEDSDRGIGFNNITVDVQPEFLGLPATLGYELVVIAVIVGLVAAVVAVSIFRRRRHGRRQQHEF